MAQRPRSALWVGFSAVCLTALVWLGESGSASAQVGFPDTGLNVDIGGGVRLRPTHLGSSVYTTDFVPLVDGQYGKNLHFSVDDGIQYTLIDRGPFKIGPDLEYRQPYNDRLATRSNRTSDAVEAGIFGKVNLV